MNAGGVENHLHAVREPVVDENTGPNTKERPKTETAQEARLDGPQDTHSLGLSPVENAPSAMEVKDEVKGAAGEAGMDWFEPLEDDDDPDDESLAGESESVAGSERAMKKIYTYVDSPRLL